MTGPRSRRRIRTANPFVMPDLAKQISDLLLTDSVLSIQFSFGSVLVMSEGFRAVSAALIGPSPKIRVTVDAAALDTGGANAEYDAVENEFIFGSNYLMSSARGRGDAVHEATHAVADYRKRSTSIRSEEGAAYVAEAWYHINIGSDPGSYLPETVMEIAAALKSRAKTASGPVSMSGAEINSVRREMMQLGYGNNEEGHFYTSNDGL